jgi:hypothetical protein
LVQLRRHHSAGIIQGKNGMNTEQVKEKLNAIYQTEYDYTVIFSGKKSNKVNGLDKPAAKEILIHNRNFVDDNLLIYTAIHELAHHVCMAERGERGARAHTLLFWSVFHDLLDNAVAKKIYARKKNEALQKLVEQAREIDRQIARLQRELGGVLLEINRICDKENIRFEDVADSEIRLSRKTRDAAVKSAQLKAPDQYGQDLQALLIGAKNDEARNDIELQAEKSIDQIKQRIKQSGQEDMYAVQRLTKEKIRIEKTIATLNLRLLQIIEEINHGDYVPEQNAADTVSGKSQINHKMVRKNG